MWFLFWSKCGTVALKSDLEDKAIASGKSIRGNRELKYIRNQN
ncbi:MAG: hypothetical protein AAGA16_19225 [Cyanobacteria bacterium P01_E01_bin.35]